MRVLFLMGLPVEGPSSRFRVYQYVPFFHEHGVEATLRPFLSSRQTPVIYGEGRIPAKLAVTTWSTLRRLVDLLNAPRYDVVYVLREAFPFGPPVFERLFKSAAGRLIFDFDDAIYIPSLAYNNPLDRLRDWDKPAKLIQMAAHVVVGNNYLKGYACRYLAREDRISVVPTAVDTKVYKPAEEVETRRTVTVGWIGTPRGSNYLWWLLPVIRELASRYPQLEFKFVGAKPFDAGGLPVEFKTWQLDEEVSNIQSFDIGIMPLTDDEETRGKCGFKLIQYMSTGLPVVCSPVGANLDIVEQGCTGLFAASLAEWTDALVKLIEDPTLRRALARAGRERVITHYSVEATGPRLLRILESVCAD